MTFVLSIALMGLLAFEEQTPGPATPGTVETKIGVTTPTEAESLAKVKAIHGGAGPWAVVGYRIGTRALADLSLPRQSFALLVVHRSPAEVQYSCVADGLQAATGASAGKLNLKLEEVPAERLETIVEDRKSGRRLRFRIKPEFARSILDLPMNRGEVEAVRVLRTPDDAIFSVEEIKPAAAPPKPAAP